MATCEHVYFDGAGHYCKLIPRPDKDYPHEHWRVMCHGNQDGWSCEAKKRGLLKGQCDGDYRKERIKRRR